MGNRWGLCCGAQRGWRLRKARTRPTGVERKVCLAGKGDSLSSRSGVFCGGARPYFSAPMQRISSEYMHAVDANHTFSCRTNYYAVHRLETGGSSRRAGAAGYFKKGGGVRV